MLLPPHDHTGNRNEVASGDAGDADGAAALGPQRPPPDLVPNALGFCVNPPRSFSSAGSGGSFENQNMSHLFTKDADGDAGLNLGDAADSSDDEEEKEMIGRIMEQGDPSRNAMAAMVAMQQFEAEQNEGGLGDLESGADADAVPKAARGRSRAAAASSSTGNSVRAATGTSAVAGAHTDGAAALVQEVQERRQQRTGPPARRVNGDAEVNLKRSGKK